jgi:phosphoglycolate phosphatase-like HAD superfamily hydrolase
MARPRNNSIRIRGFAALVLITISSAIALAQADPLPSWNEGEKRRAILDFVSRVTREGGPDFVPVSERIATFDNDGTLWAEQPIYFQFAFAIDRVKTLAPRHPEWKSRQPFKAVLDGDMESLAGSGEKELGELIMATHTGITTDEFSKSVAEWLATANHPRFKRPYTELVYQPMLELLTFLRQNGFKTFIVSGGTVEFMRVFSEKVYGIPPEQVVGTSFLTKFQMNTAGTPVLMRQAKIDFIDDGPGKPVGIQKFIGRRPILAFGNSDGDLQMLEWTAAGSGPRFMALVRHTDGEREWSYDRQSQVGHLDKALDEAASRKWVVVDMKRDWKVIFPNERTVK